MMRVSSAIHQTSSWRIQDRAPQRCHAGAMASEQTGTEYARFLPAEHREATGIRPDETWWDWNGHRVHIARARATQAPARVLVVHGAGGHSGALWPFAALLADRGLDVAAVDLPLYGRTETHSPEEVRYDDWISLLVDLLEAENDGRPVILLGASIGGMLAYEVASRTPLVSAVVATCLLDPLDLRVRARMTRFGPAGVLGGPLARLVRGAASRVMIPMRWVADLAKMSLDPGLSRLCADDPLGGAARVPLGFLRSFLTHRHIDPALVTTPLILAHPERDAWTPVTLSLPVLRSHGGASRLVMLRGCGHFPIEQPGLDDLIQVVVDAADDAAVRRDPGERIQEAGRGARASRPAGTD